MSRSRLPVGSSASSSGGSATEGAGQRHALLLAARELAGIVAEAVAEADRAQRRLGAVEGVGAAGEFQRDRDVLQRRHGRDQVEGLEHDADMVAAEARQRVLVHAPRGRGRRRASGPPVGRSSPASSIISEDLPEPEGPTRPTASPAPTSRSMPRRMLTGPAAPATLNRRSVAAIE